VYGVVLFLVALGSVIVGFGGFAAGIATAPARVVFPLAVSAALVGLLRSAPRCLLSPAPRAPANVERR